MMIYILIICIGLLLFFSFSICKHDIMSPSVLLCIGYLVSGICCALNKQKWGVDLRFNTCLVLLTGIGFFVFGEVLVRLCYKDRRPKSNEMPKLRPIDISTSKVFFFTVYNLVIMIFAIKEMLDITGGFQQSLSQTMYEFRYAYSYTNTQLNTLLIQLIKVSKGSSYAFLYVFFNNIMTEGPRNCRRKARKNVKLLIPIFVYIIETLSRGGRLNIIVFSVSAIFLFYFNWNRYMGWDVQISKKFIKKMVCIFVLFIIMFYYLKGLVGRLSTESIFDYMTKYFGGSFQLLDQYLNDSISNAGRGTLESFPGVYQSLYKLGIVKNMVHKSLEFRYTSTGYYLGNIYTGLRRFYNDFGYLGVILVQMIYAYIFTYIYIKIKNILIINTNRAFLVLAYSVNLFAVITQAMEDHFWIDLGIGWCIEIFIMWICFKYILEFKHVGNYIIKRCIW